jgi:hypothetical protein
MPHTAVEEPLMFDPIQVLGTRETVACAEEASRPLTVMWWPAQVGDHRPDLVLAHRYALPVVTEIRALTAHPDHSPAATPATPS